MPSIWTRGVSGARFRLQAARNAFQDHSNDCAVWDYEGDNDCPDCLRTREDLRRARESLRRAEERAITYTPKRA